MCGQRRFLRWRFVCFIRRRGWQIYFQQYFDIHSLRFQSAFVEFGPGNVLTGLVKRILPDMVTGNVSDESTLRQSLPLLKGVAR